MFYQIILCIGRLSQIEHYKGAFFTVSKIMLARSYDFKLRRNGMKRGNKGFAFGPGMQGMLKSGADTGGARMIQFRY